MPSNAQSSHAGKKAPNMSKEGAPASEQPHRDSSGSVRTQAPTGRRLIPCHAQYESRAAQHGSALRQDSLATVIRTLRRAAMPHILRPPQERRSQCFPTRARHRVLVESCGIRTTMTQAVEDLLKSGVSSAAPKDKTRTIASGRGTGSGPAAKRSHAARPTPARS
jgi:hypothetical protein